jgi:hypothetical protein
MSIAPRLEWVLLPDNSIATLILDAAAAGGTRDLTIDWTGAGRCAYRRFPAFTNRHASPRTCPGRGNRRKVFSFGAEPPRW